MRGGGVLHPELAAAIAEIGHGDVVVLADAGLRIPSGARSIHLELTCGIPTMQQVLAAVAGELVVERALVASELAEWNPAVDAAVRALLSSAPDTMPHAELMAEMAGRAMLYVKTGECSAYASVVLIGGVSYFDEAAALHDRLLRDRGAPEGAIDRDRRKPASSPLPGEASFGESRRRTASYVPARDGQIALTSGLIAVSEGLPK